MTNKTWRLEIRLFFFLQIRDRVVYDLWGRVRWLRRHVGPGAEWDTHHLTYPTRNSMLSEYRRRSRYVFHETKQRAQYIDCFISTHHAI